MSARTSILALIAAVCLSLWGCGGESVASSSEMDDSSYRVGQQLEKEGRWEEALAAYLRVVSKRGDTAPESNLAAGLIYLNHLQNPIFAIYHLSKYLQMEPNSKKAPMVRGMIDSAKREFARSLPGSPLEAASEQLGLGEQLSRLQRENDELRAENAALRSGASVPVTHSTTIDLTAIPKAEPAADQAPADGGSTAISLAPVAGDAGEASPISDAPERAASDPQPKAAAPAGRHHVVAKGDTLFNLSIKYYGSRTRWREIYAANKAVLPSESTPLKIGTDLRIP